MKLYCFFNLKYYIQVINQFKLSHIFCNRSQLNLPLLTFLQLDLTLPPIWIADSINVKLLDFFLSDLVFSKGKQFFQKYSRLRCLLRVKGLAICFCLGWSGSILQFRQNIIKVGSKSCLLTCSSNITLSHTGSALKRELNLCNSYFSLLYF